MPTMIAPAGHDVILDGTGRVVQGALRIFQPAISDLSGLASRCASVVVARGARMSHEAATALGCPRAHLDNRPSVAASRATKIPKTITAAMRRRPREDRISARRRS